MSPRIILWRSRRGEPPELPYLTMGSLWTKSMHKPIFESTQERRIDKGLSVSEELVRVIDRGHGPFKRRIQQLCLP